MAEAAAVLDASALIALLRREAGADEVAGRAQGASISAVNWIEVIEVIARLGRPVGHRRAQIEALGISLVPLSGEQAEGAAAMQSLTRKAGLSLADRACLALAAELGAPALTADKAWAKVEVGVEVKLIR